MSALLFLGAASQTAQSGGVDLFARGLAVLAFVISAVSLIRQFVESGRKRRSKLPEGLRVIVEGFLNDLSGARQNANRIVALNSAVAQANSELLSEITKQLPDRPLARKLRRLHGALDAARVIPDSSASENELTFLTHSQSERVGIAIDAAKQVIARVDKLSRQSPG